MSEQQEQVWRKADLEAALSIKEETEKERVRYLKLKGGEHGYEKNFVRIAPPHVNMKTFFVAYPIHFNIGPVGAQRSFGCRRKQFGGQCIICNEGFRLYNAGQQDAAKSFFPNWRYYMNVFVLKQEGDELVLADDHPYVLSVGMGLFEQIWDEFEPDANGVPTLDLTDVDKGFNLLIKRQGTDKKTTEYKVQKAGGPTPFPGDLSLLSEIYDLTTLVEFPDEDAIVRILSGESAPQKLSDPWAEAAALPAGQEDVVEDESREVAEEGTTPEDKDDLGNGDADQAAANVQAILRRAQGR